MELPPPFERLSSVSPELGRAVELLRLAAPTRLPVLIYGATGTGKEVAARALHRASERTGSFVALNFAAIPADLFEDELFGHEPGAFTGAAGRRLGAVSRANRGTLLLDEVGELLPHLQAKLLRFLQDGTYAPLGGDRLHQSDIRLVAATHRDLPAMVRSGAFREDLFHRLAFVPIRLPALAERMGDLPALIASIAIEIGFEPALFGPDVISVLGEHDFPGNIRELRTVLTRLALLSSPPRPDDVRAACRSTLRSSAPTLRAASDDAIGEALAHAEGSVARAAAMLGVHRSTVYRRLGGRAPQ